MTSEKQNSANALEQFVLLAKTAKGIASVELTKQALDAPGVYVFGELLDMPNIKQLTDGPNSGYFHLLTLFAYGTYKDYKENQANLPALSPLQQKKLRHLTIVSLSTKNKCIPYPLLLEELDLKNLRELEDLIIEAVYSDIIQGKLDQERQQLEVDCAIGRDIRPEAIAHIASVLQNWCSSCDTILKEIETQIQKANAYKESHAKIQAHVEQEVANIKKTLKTSSQQQDSDEHMVTDSMPTTSTDKPIKKPSKSKGINIWICA